jgi:hypothetical protein
MRLWQAAAQESESPKPVKDTEPAPPFDPDAPPLLPTLVVNDVIV